jgi:hypothetical protein
MFLSCYRNRGSLFHDWLGGGGFFPWRNELLSYRFWCNILRYQFFLPNRVSNDANLSFLGHRWLNGRLLNHPRLKKFGGGIY